MNTRFALASVFPAALFATQAFATSPSALHFFFAHEVSTGFQIAVIAAGLVGILGVMGTFFLWAAVRRKGRTLAETKETYQQMLNAIPDLVLVKGPHSKIVWANRAFRDYYGMSLKQLTDIIDAPFSPADQTQQYVRDDLWVWENARPLEVEEPVTRYDGAIRTFHTIKVPLFDSSGKVTFTLGVSRDITDRLHHEVVIREQQNQMVTASKMSSLGEMASGIAHEINNPLSTISMKSQQLLELSKENELTPAITAEFAGVIHATTQRIAAIVRALKSFARDGSGDPVTTESLHRLIYETLELCRERFRNHDIALRVEGEFTGLSIDCRGVQVSQIILNLLNNAHDAVTGQNEKWISLGVKDLGDAVEISVTDSGPGIPAVMRDKVMQPFFTTKEVGRGTGLGLSISRGFAESHRGSLTLDQSSERTRFVLRLPKKHSAP